MGDEMALDRYSALIEAILFYEGEVVSVEKLKQITGLDKEKIVQIIHILQEKYLSDEHGINIIEIADGFCFQIKKVIINEFKQVYAVRDKSKLSKSAMTVLSIIAYKQPITKNEIEAIRGVSADNQVRMLMEKNLIEVVGRKEALGRPMLLGTTKDFLKFFNLTSIQDLPTINELKSDEFRADDE